MLDVVVVGGGQAGLAAGFYLRRAGLGFEILDAQEVPGGAWPHMWESLRLFSPAQHSSLPGRPMPRVEGYPGKRHVARYLASYEERYDLPVRRPVRVEAVRAEPDALRVETDRGMWRARCVVSATGTWWQPYLPHHPGRAAFRGRQLHAARYRHPEPFGGLRVVVVGGGNSAAQIVADLAGHADTTWVTRRPPRFLPDDVDGRALFEVATRRRQALLSGEVDTGGVGGLGDIVVVPPVRAARDRGLLAARPLFSRLTAEGVAWDDGTRLACDAIIWCTGFRPALRHLTPLGLREGDGTIAVNGTQSVAEPRLFLLGYGDWTGPGSATLIGAGRDARGTVAAITRLLSSTRSADPRISHHTTDGR
nr:ArsO family NAD(P)H-dependent flavin-containing monooxygenase [Thermomonospora umbrina]